MQDENRPALHDVLPWEKLVSLVESTLDSHSVAFERNDRIVRIRDVNGEFQDLDLDEFTRQTRWDAPEDLPARVEAVVRNMQLGPFGGLPQSSDEARPLLRVRVRNREDRLEECVRREFNEFAEVLVVDLPDEVRGVNAHDLQKWALSEDEAFEAARTNTRQAVRPSVWANTMPEGYLVTSVIGDYFATSHLLWLQEESVRRMAHLRQSFSDVVVIEA